MPIIKSIKATSNPDWILIQVEPVTHPDGSKQLFKAMPYPAELAVGLAEGDNITVEDL